MFSGSAGAQTPVFEQAVIPDDNGVGPGLLLAIGSSCPFGNTSADDFTLGQSVSITRLTWEGVYFGAASDFPGKDDGFHVTFYQDNGAGNVGAVLMDFPGVVVTKMLSSRPPVFGTNPVYVYDVTLPSAVSVVGGQRYWLSVNGDPAGAGGPVFGWMASTEGNAASIPGNDQPLQNTSITCGTLPAATYNPGGDLGDQDSDLAFALYAEGIGVNYCGPGVPNSTGASGGILAMGSNDADDENLSLLAFDLPPGNVCLFIASVNQGFIQPPRSCGNLCLMGPDIARFKLDAQIVDTAGQCLLQVDPFVVLTNPPQAIVNGQTWNFQAWHRDAAAGPDCNNNFTDATEVTFKR